MKRKWKAGKRGRPPIGHEYDTPRRKSNNYAKVCEREIKRICICIENMASLAGISDKRMASIIMAGIIRSEPRTIPGIIDIMKAIKKTEGDDV